MTGNVLAVDIGGTKLAVGIVDDKGRLLERHVVATPRTDDAEELFAALAGAIDDLGDQGRAAPMRRRRLRRSDDGRGRARLAVEHPGLARASRCGPGSPNTAAAPRLRSTTTPRRWPAARAGSGAAAGVRDYIAMVVSTGVGGGIVVDGRLLDGADGNAGHVGHIIVEPDGAICGCGAHGCVEAEASGTAIARITGRPPADASNEIRTRTGRLVGRAIASVANLLDLQLAVVSGSVALGYGDTFFTAAQTEIDARCRLDFSRGTVVVPGALGDDGPLVGAAAVARFVLRSPDQASWKRPPSITTTPSWFTVWKIDAPEPSSHILTVSVSPG